MNCFPDISVIVPVYNVEKYIVKCLLSLVNQTYKNFEVIVVDDGSSDNSINLAKEVIGGDERFKIVSKSNGGLSSARNFGVENSQGEYISFLDSDDYFHVSFLEKMHNVIVSNDADIVVCSMYLVDEEYNVLDERGAKNDMLITGREAFLDNLLTKTITSGAQNKLYKRNLITSHPYPIGLLYEDRATTYKMFLDSKNIFLLSEPLFFYLQRNGSIMRSISRKSIDDRFVVFNMIKQELIERDLYCKYSDYYNASFILNVLLAGSRQVAIYSSNKKAELDYLLAKSDFNPINLKSMRLLLFNQPKKFFAFCLLCFSKRLFIRVFGKFRL